MRVDFDRALAAIQAATQFDWTWTVDDLPTFSEPIGWQSSSPDDKYPSLTTNLDVNRTDASVSVDHTARPDVRRPLQRIRFYASDVVLDDPSVQPELDQAFDDLAQRVFEMVGQRPTGWSLEPLRSLRWDLPTIVVTLYVSGEDVSVYLVGPEYQRWLDEIEASGDD
ncbi:hypothetical protein IU429_29365 [Nocardia elegans]|uniref:DUF6301 family protein n=1 Tax=Nocardia elegans TaxID=300029 RepID=A0ABW6TL25_9NOCA|nr:DUF6301 family protein [Nocardia elegans]MBF6451778.1 hypothetical protein [Nocardia elegans]